MSNNQSFVPFATANLHHPGVSQTTTTTTSSHSKSGTAVEQCEMEHFLNKSWFQIGSGKQSRNHVAIKSSKSRASKSAVKLGYKRVSKVH